MEIERFSVTLMTAGNSLSPSGSSVWCWPEEASAYGRGACV